MRTYEKIDFLMKLSETSNASLGKVLNFDPSYISRIRSGKRSIPKDDFIYKLAMYFINHLNLDYQKKIMSDFIQFDFSQNKKEVINKLVDWLLSDDLESDRIEVKKEVKTEVKEPIFYYGNSGKREVVKHFLEEVNSLDNPPKLYLYSNEDFSWLYEDKEFASYWAFLLGTYIKKGGKIKIAHTISRASGEMLEALRKWIPIYKTGAIEPFYYPKVLDRVFKKTMFVAKDHSAIISSSIGENLDDGINLYLTDLEAVNKVLRELEDFFKRCKPLMKIYSVINRDEFLDSLFSFSKIKAKMITVRNTPSLYTLPKEVALSMAKRSGSDDIIKRQEICSKAFLEMTRDEEFVEILNLANLNDFDFHFPYCDLMEKTNFTYTLEEYKAHIKSLIDKLKTYPNYQVIIVDKLNNDEIILVKEDVGVILVKTTTPSIAFTIDEQRMVSSFYDYLSEVIDRNSNKEKVIKYLEKYLKDLEN